MKGRAAVLTGIKDPFVIEEVEFSSPGPGEVMVKMVATGVCRSDINFWAGDKVISPFPVVLGHEGAGVIAEVGEGVDEVKVGDHVVLTYLPACGRCRWCHTGQPNMCDMGGMLNKGLLPNGEVRMRRPSGESLHHFLFVSTFAEYSVCPAASVVKVADYIDLRQVCLFGCGFSSGYGAVMNAVHVRPGECVLIVGCGGLGLAAVQAAKACGAGKIIAVDVHQEKLTLARQFGATHTIQNQHRVGEVLDKVNEITWGVGADYAFEFVGHSQAPETLEIGFMGVRKQGTFCMVGVATSKMGYLPLAPGHLTYYRKRVKGVLFGDIQFRYDIPRYVKMYEEGKIDLNNMISHRLRLDQINDAVENIMAEKEVVRQVIYFD